MATLRLTPRLMQGGQVAMGPGKADLLDAIAEHGSISAAARALDMSYRRAWQLVDVMNHCWSAPLVEAATGGRKGGGAHLTELGMQVRDTYRALGRRLAQEVERGPELEKLASLLRPTS